MSKRSARIVTEASEPWRRKAAAGEEITDAVIHKTFIPEVKAAGDNRRVTFTISTEAVDREGDTIAVDGWQVDNYLKNPVVLFAHRYDQLPIGKCLSLTKADGALRAEAEFVSADVNPVAESVYQMLKGGFLRATSVGFRPIKGEPADDRGPGYCMDFLEQELLEFSVVPVPSNPEALMETAKGLAGAMAAGIDVEPLERALAAAKVLAGPRTKAVVPPAKKDDQRLIPADALVKIQSAVQSIEAGLATLDGLIGVDGATVAEAATPTVEKSGRKISAATAKCLRDAIASIASASAHHKDASDGLGGLLEEGVDAGDDTGASPEGNTDATSVQPVPSTDGDQPWNRGAYVISREDLEAACEAAISAAVTAGARAALN